MIAPRIRTIAGLMRLVAHFGLIAARTRLKPRSLAERLAMLPSAGLPVEAPVTIHWSAQQVPFIEAGRDTDLATALGLVHAHLRLGQMELMRRIAQGRLSEMVGPATHDIDHLLRILDFGRAVPDMLAGLPDETRAWLDAYVAGINHCVNTAQELPHEFDVLGLERTPWSVSDILRIGRLAASDANWIVWFQLLKLRQGRDWPRLWRRLTEAGTVSVSELVAGQSSPFGPVLGLSARWASNSAAVAATRSGTGGAMLANDPHLGIFMPGPWLIAGYKSETHNAVGFMAPGLPFMVLGRNPWIAWGGTNLHAASSDLVDVSDLAPGDFTERHERLRTRWWRDRTVTVRETEFGPVLSDASLLGLDRRRPVALRWIGHRPSDEITAMLQVNRARNWDAFRSAIDGIAVSGQTMTYADVDGRVGRAIAARLPLRHATNAPDMVLGRTGLGHWQQLVSARDLPSVLDPPDGVIASANDEPDGTDGPVGFFYSPPDRARRLRALLSAPERVSLDDLKAALTDVHMATSLDLRDRFLTILRSAPAGSRAAGGALETALEIWDGDYDAGSPGALAFELLLTHFVRRFYPATTVRAYWTTWTPRAFVRDDLEAADPAVASRALVGALKAARRGFRRFGTWGSLHRMRLAHPFANVPLFGRAYVFADVPAEGGNDSLHKTGHGLGARRHTVRFGSGARQISDLSDPDGNRLVLLGGQDGWLGSDTLADQQALWRAGEYLTVPLRPETARARFPHRTEIAPDGMT